MANLSVLVVSYVVGGITFIPLIALFVFAHGYLFLPRPNLHEPYHQADLDAPEDGSSDVDSKLLDRSQEPDVAAGYFAVCREYVPGGVNGKPPERTTPAGETIAAESPSVYQSMYRTIFDRNKTQVPSIEGGKLVKKARNVFYVVLRHGHLLLFDNSEQLEVRHVIALAHYDLDLYAGGDALPEGELYIKRNCIRLKKKITAVEQTSRSMPFYLFSDNCSEKEDFYHALVHSQASSSEVPDGPPNTMMFETEDMIKLVRALHVSDESQHTRWLNALIGRLFLAVYKTVDTESLLRTKIEKKISRVPKPTFLTSLTLESVHMGNSAPTIVNPKLREMTVDGALTLEADIKYSGSFKVVIAAVARIELGTRFKPRTVSLVLASILKRLDGHLLIRIKPPPSNRIWISFETMPKLDVSVEPVVSSRQITYGIILRAIESRIREVIGETVVLPNWDDVPFFDTEQQSIRGGIWQREATPEKPMDSAAITDDDLVTEAAEEALLMEESSIPSALLANKPKKDSTSQLTSPRGDAPSSLAATSKNGQAQSLADSTSSSQSSISTPPKMMRSNSFATAATPVVTKDDQYVVDTNKNISRGLQQGATSAMKELSTRSYDTSSADPPTPSPGRNPTHKAFAARTADLVIPSDQSNVGTERVPHFEDKHVEGSRTSSDSQQSSRLSEVLGKSSNEPSTARPTPLHTALSPSAERKQAINQSIGSATAAAKKWGMGVLNRQVEWKKQTSAPVVKSNVGQPYGRGQPLPPPGTPLPRPESSNSWSATALNSLKRKSVAVTSDQPIHDSLPSNESDPAPGQTQHTPSISSGDSNEPASTGRLADHGTSRADENPPVFPRLEDEDEVEVEVEVEVEDEIAHDHFNTAAALSSTASKMESPPEEASTVAYPDQSAS